MDSTMAFIQAEEKLPCHECQTPAPTWGLFHFQENRYLFAAWQCSHHLKSIGFRWLDRERPTDEDCETYSQYFVEEIASQMVPDKTYRVVYAPHQDEVYVIYKGPSFSEAQAAYQRKAQEIGHDNDLHFTEE